jgi:hypothetical protein
MKGDTKLVRYHLRSETATSIDHSDSFSYNSQSEKRSGSAGIFLPIKHRLAAIYAHQPHSKLDIRGCLGLFA